ncbi:hypothetical protein BurJ1DRAFT_4197 [Burkholderiales bacterium JOSHI_001]|nr:hypothetical protein BurJ1DRAFT_4197 [Burkholderiales bacterium JOSHI_001]
MSSQPAGLQCSLLLVLAVLAAPAHAGRPFSTEDTGVLEPRDCEWEGFSARLKSPGADTARALSTQLACGLGLRTQLGLAYGQAKAGGDTARSLGLNGKTRLGGDSKAPLQWTLAWGAAALKEPGSSFKFDTVYANLVASQVYGNGWTAHANLGTAHSRLGHQASTTWALAAEKAVGAGVDLGAELYGDDRSEPWVGLGVRWAASDAISVNASWARQGGSNGARLVSAGFKLAF